jgi:hypothetical protein
VWNPELTLLEKKQIISLQTFITMLNLFLITNIKVNKLFFTVGNAGKNQMRVRIIGVYHILSINMIVFADVY